MSATVLAGRFAPRGNAGTPGGAELERALKRDGPAASVELEPLALAWTPPAPAPARDRTICLIDGTPRTDALAADVGLPATTPAEVIVAQGYERLGDAVVKRLDGPFAIVIWKPDERRGLLARDRLGSKPLFVAEAGGALLFASEVRNLLALLRTAPAPDPVGMTYWLARSQVSDPRTLYAGIERLPAAHLLSLGTDGWRRERWWAPRYAEPAPIEAEDAAREMRAGIGRAVSRALGGASKPALMLSGGFDSAAVAASARAASPAAYSAVFPEEPAVDESEQIARVRESLGMAGVEERFTGASALAAAAEFVREWELPSVSPNLFVWSPLLRRAAADGVDVVLDGEGGDELFGCARYLVADRVRAGRPLAAVRTARRLPGMGERPRVRWLRRALISYGVRAALPYAAHERLRAARGRGAAGPSWLADEAARIHRGAHDPWAWKRIAGPRWWAQLSHVLTLTGEGLGAPDQLRREGRLTGVDLRHPLRDPELVDLALRMPPELAFHPQLDRPLARRAFAGELPPETLRSDRKPAFNSLLESALGGPDRGALAGLLADPHPALARLLRPTALDDLLRAPDAAPPPLTRALDLWRIAQLEMWLRQREDPGGEWFPAPSGEASGGISFTAVSGDMRQPDANRKPRGSVPT